MCVVMQTVASHKQVVAVVHAAAADATPAPAAAAATLVVVIKGQHLCMLSMARSCERRASSQ